MTGNLRLDVTTRIAPRCCSCNAEVRNYEPAGTWQTRLGCSALWGTTCELCMRMAKLVNEACADNYNALVASGQTSEVAHEVVREKFLVGHRRGIA